MVIYNSISPFSLSSALDIKPFEPIVLDFILEAKELSLPYVLSIILSPISFDTLKGVPSKYTYFLRS